MTEQEYNRDNGYKSRKLLLTIAGVILLIILGPLYSIYNWDLSSFNTIASSVVTLILGYLGISTARATIPRAVEKIKQNTTTQSIQSMPTKNQHNNGSEEI